VAQYGGNDRQSCGRAGNATAIGGLGLILNVVFVDIFRVDASRGRRGLAWRGAYRSSLEWAGRGRGSRWNDGW
jgi:hypothetical protein